MPFSLSMNLLCSTVRLRPSARMPAPLRSGTAARAKVRLRTVMSLPAITKIPLPAQVLSASTAPSPVASMVSLLARQTAQSV